MTETTEPAVQPVIAEILPVTIAPPNSMRCARCGAQAYVEVQMLVGGRLEWCSHHYDEHEAAIILRARKVIDHRPYLRSLERSPTEKPRTDRR